MVGYVPLPSQWPEQELTIVEEDFSPAVRVGYQTVEGTVKLMVVKIPRLGPGEEANALLTYEIRRYALLPPERPEIYVLADPRKLPRTVRPYLAAGPLIDSKNPKIKAALRQTGAETKQTAWQQVEAIYDWVRARIEFTKGPARGALAALRDGVAGEEDITFLFIALCRAAEVPARTVWVPGHCYPEFYLQDDEGQGHWFPCEMTGARSFGGISEHRPVIEKGDDFRPPYSRRDRQRFLAEFFTGAGQAKARFVRLPAAL